MSLSRTVIADGPMGRVGAPRKYNYNALVQGLADGKTVAEAAEAIDMNVFTAPGIVTYLRKQHRVTNIPHLVAHYIRNGWID